MDSFVPSLAGRHFFMHEHRESSCKALFFLCSLSSVSTALSVTSYKIFSTERHFHHTATVHSPKHISIHSCILNLLLQEIASFHLAPPAFLQGKFLNSFIFASSLPLNICLQPLFASLFRPQCKGILLKCNASFETCVAFFCRLLVKITMRLYDLHNQILDFQSKRNIM